MDPTPAPSAPPPPSVDDIIAAAFLDCFQEDEERRQYEMDSEYLWTVGPGPAKEGEPYYIVKSLADREKVPFGGSYIATKRQMIEWNEEGNARYRIDRAERIGDEWERRRTGRPRRESRTR